MKTLINKTIGSVAIIGVGLLVCTTVRSFEAGVPVSKNEAMSVFGGSCGLTVKACPAKDSCPSSSFFLNGTDVMGLKPDGVYDADCGSIYHSGCVLVVTMSTGCGT